MVWRENNFAFIDSQNLNLGVQRLGWKLDFQKLRIYLAEKYDVVKAYLFLGYIPKNKELYKKLESYGYALIFKPVITLRDGTIKGNVDGELILQAMVEYQNYDRAVIVTGDGDFHCLIDHLRLHNKLKAVYIPNRGKFSRLLKSNDLHEFRRYMNEAKNDLRLTSEA